MLDSLDKKILERLVPKEKIELLEEFDLDVNSRIMSPGKFEGEFLYAPYFYQQYLDGWSCEDTDEGVLLEVVDADLEVFPELTDSGFVRLVIDDNGFVYCYPLDGDKEDPHVPTD